MAASSLWRTSTGALRSATNASSELTYKLKDLPKIYAEYVASNASSVGQVESTLRSLTYLLPGARLNDSELASESVHTFVQLLSIYHDHLLKKKVRVLAEAPRNTSQAIIPKPSPHARYTAFWSDSSSTYTKVAMLLKVVQYTELLWEMVARRRGGEKSRWRTVVFLESLKAVLRVVLMRLTNSRLLVTPPLPQREDFAPIKQEEEALEDFSEEDMKVLDPIPFEPKDAFGESGVPTPPMSESDKAPLPPHHNHDRADLFAMPRTGFTMPILPSPDSISSYLFEHVITPDDIKPVQQLIHRLSTYRGQAAELLYIARPVVYALLMQRVAARCGYEGSKWKKVWSPWIAGVTIEYFARQFAKQDLTSRTPGGARGGLSALEREEFTKRGWQLAWWSMRGAFYENVTKTAVNKVVGGLRGKPLLDLVGGVVEDYEHLWSNYWFSTSTM